MRGFKGNIKKACLDNKNFRKVIYTGSHLQVVIMSLRPGEDIEEEILPDNDQFFRFEKGIGKCIINDTEMEIKEGDVIVVPAGTKRNIRNVDLKNDLKLYSIYSPPFFRDGIIRETKEDAIKNPAPYDGITSDYCIPKTLLPGNLEKDYSRQL